MSNDLNLFDEWWRENLLRKKEFKPGDLVKPYEFFEDAIASVDPTFLSNFRVELETVAIVLCLCQRSGGMHVNDDSESARLMVLMCDGRVCWWDEMYTEHT